MNYNTTGVPPLFIGVPLATTGGNLLWVGIGVALIVFAVCTLAYGKVSRRRERLVSNA